MSQPLGDGAPAAMTHQLDMQWLRGAAVLGALGSLFMAACARPDTAPAHEAAPDEANAPASLQLPQDPKAALAALRSASSGGTVAVFKHSPICPVSAAAQERFRGWVAERGPEAPVSHVQIDVLGEKPLARGLVAELGIKHESPQVLLFHEGELVWHASHHAITGEALSEQLAEL